jgi:hypothetical protein
MAGGILIAALAVAAVPAHAGPVAVSAPGGRADNAAIARAKAAMMHILVTSLSAPG